MHLNFITIWICKLKNWVHVILAKTCIAGFRVYLVLQRIQNLLYLIVICIISSKVNYDNILTSIVTSFSHKLLPFSFSIFTYFCIASSLVYKRKIRHISRHDYALYDTSTFCLIKEKAKDELCFFLSSYTSSQYQIFKVMGFFSNTVSAHYHELYVNVHNPTVPCIVKNFNFGITDFLLA